MAVSIENPAECEIWFIIRLLHAKWKLAVKIYKEIVFVYGNKNVIIWCYALSTGKPNDHKESKTDIRSVILGNSQKNQVWSFKPSTIQCGTCTQCFSLILFLEYTLSRAKYYDDDEMNIDV